VLVLLSSCLKIFVWGMASWDLWGTYPDSMRYRDVEMVRKISQHNMQVVAAKALALQVRCLDAANEA